MTLEQKAFILVSGGLIIAMKGLGFMSSATHQLLLLAGGVVLLGVPHGALDFWVAVKSEVISSPSSKLTFLLIYGVLALLAGWVWLSHPVIALCLFLIYGGYHFSLDWYNRVSRPGALAVGLSVVSVPSLAHGEHVSAIFTTMVGQEVVFLFPAIQAVALASGLIVAIEVVQTARYDIALSVELTLIVVAAVMLPPLVFFTAFFCFLHSIRHLRGIADELYLSPIGLISRSITFTALTLAFVCVAWMTLGFQLTWQDKLVNAIFIGLAVLTVPHMLLHLYLELVRRRAAAQT